MGRAGDGNFSFRAPRSRVQEADAAGVALEATARRLGKVLERERASSADVSYQVRTRSPACCWASNLRWNAPART